tara:strand:- start:308 stop:820 length:513 start_codon:yes stop_codon:yes gene_type:complete
MRKIFLLIYILIIFIFSATFSYSVEKIIFIDFEYIINNSERGKLIYKDLDKIKNENIKKLNLNQKELKNQENDIQLKKDIISKEELDKKLKSLNNSIKNFQNKKLSMENELNKIKNKKMNDFMNQINPLLKKYMDNQDVDIMLNSKNILIGKKTINKTDDILKLINKNIK